MVPGRALRRVAKVLLPAQICDQIVDAQLADFQHEWSRASSVRARALVLYRGYLAFLVILVSCAVGLRGVEADERRELRRVFAIASIGAFVATVGLAMVFMGNLQLPALVEPAREVEFQRFRLVMFFNMASQVLPLAVAVGLVCGIAMGLRREASHASRRALLMVAVVCSAMIFVMSSWILPPGFRALSQAIRGQPSAGQPAASTLGDTRRWMVAIERTRTAGPGSIRSAEVYYHFRWSWPFAVFALGFFALSLNRRGRTVRIGVGLAACVLYSYLVSDVANGLVWTSHLSPMLVAWTPNLIFVALALSVTAMSVTVRRFVDARSA